MMLELAQHIQVFLHKHDRPPVSLYEEMVERQRAEERREREREEKERQLSRIKEEEQVLLLLLVNGVSGYLEQTNMG
jgi:translation initiation factor 2-alpha kinase 4